MAVMLILVDGMRPDSLEKSVTARSVLKEMAYTLEGTTVYPSVTLPCHVSLVTSNEPSVHGTATNVFVPWPETITGLFEVLAENRKKTGFFYNWEELRDIALPGSISHTAYYKPSDFPDGRTNDLCASDAAEFWSEEKPDFMFLYLGNVDYVGHAFGWMSDAYVEAVEQSWRIILRMTGMIGPGDTLIVTADHGGHGNEHGSRMPSDMVIPFAVRTIGNERCSIRKNASIMDVAPTITRLLGIVPDPSWKGSPLI